MNHWDKPRGKGDKSWKFTSRHPSDSRWWRGCSMVYVLAITIGVVIYAAGVGISW